MSRRDAWTMAALPKTLQAHAHAVTTLAGLNRARAHALAANPALMTPSQAQAARERALLVAQHCDVEAAVSADPATPLYWVTEAMAQVALDASQDIPAITVSGAPSPSGVIAVQKGLPALDSPDGHGWMTMASTWHTAPIAPDLFLWHTTDDEFHVIAYAHTSRMPSGVRFYDGPLHELLTLIIRRSPDGSWPVLDAPDPEVPLPREHVRGMEMIQASGPRLAVLAWLAAAWHLMLMPTVAEARRIGPAPAPRNSHSTTPAAEPAITRVDLRPLRTVPTEIPAQPAEAPTRTHRWIVRGHWTHQPHGPGGRQRRLQWRESYIKGPAGAPLSRSRPVNVWRR